MLQICNLHTVIKSKKYESLSKPMIKNLKLRFCPVDQFMKTDKLPNIQVTCPQ